MVEAFRSRLSRSWTQVAVVIVLAVLVRVPTLDQPLIEHHTWRQTQTAYTAVVYAEQGIDLLHPRLPVVGPPFEAPYEFPLFQAVAALLIDAGLPADMAGRLLGLISFALSAALVWLVGRMLLGPRVALVAVIAYTASPLSLMFGRQFLIEYMAVFAALAFVAAAIKWIETARARWLIAAIVSGGVAALLKQPTWAPWLLVIVAYLVDRRVSWRSRLPGLVALAAVPLLAGLIWTGYADAVKADSPITRGLTVAGMLDWNYASITHLLDVSSWASVGLYFAWLTCGVGWLPLLLGVPAAARRVGRNATVLALLAVGVVPVLALFNIYVVHDYYQIAISPAWALLLGLGGAYIADRLAPRGALTILAASGFSVAAAAPFLALIYQGAAADSGHFLDQAAEIDRNSTPDELVIVPGADYLPTPLYYARRWGLAIPYGVDIADIRASAALYSVMSIRSTADADISVMDLWTWVAPVAPHTYRLGIAADQLPPNAARWTDTDVRFNATATGGPIDVVCDRDPTPDGDSGIEISVGAAGSAVEVRGSTPSGARLWLGDLAPVPARGHLLVPPSATVRIACTGTTSVRVEVSALAAWPPMPVSSTDSPAP